MESVALWKSVLSEIEMSVSEAIFKTAFAKSELQNFSQSIATIAINPGMRLTVESRYYSLIKGILDQLTKENTSLVFTDLIKKVELKPESAGPLFADSFSHQQQSVASLARKLHIRSDATFDSFAVSPSNQLAHAAATAVARSPGTAYNPLFLYGGVGVGKTHLMHAVANDILKRKPTTKIVYAMGEEFLNQIVEAIQKKTSLQLKQRYRSAELLLIDDVQFIAGKQTAQEEFFHTFNAVHREGGQIILTSDRPPSEIAKLEDRLRSRFEGGLTVDVSAPDFELRVAIINIKALALNLPIPSNVAQLIASTLTDTRALEGFLRKLMNEVAIKKADITLETVASMLHVSPEISSNPPTQQQNRRVTPIDVLEAVSSYYDIKPMHLKGPKRDRPIVRPRQLIMFLCYKELRVTLDDIGGLLGGRDHSTVLHGIETIEKELSTNQQIRDALVGIKSKLFT